MCFEGRHYLLLFLKAVTLLFLLSTTFASAFVLPSTSWIVGAPKKTTSLSSLSLLHVQDAAKKSNHQFVDDNANMIQQHHKSTTSLQASRPQIILEGPDTVANRRISRKDTDSTTPGQHNNLFRHLVVPFLIVIISLSNHPIDASATGFGPSGATMSPPQGMTVLGTTKSSATTSSPRTIKSTIVGDSNNNAVKYNNIFGRSLNDKQTFEELSDQLDRMIDGMDSIIREEPKASEDGDEERLLFESIQQQGNQMEKEIQEMQQYVEKQRVLARERFMEMLESQPYWFDYFAAFVGSVMSTLIMHPVDTIKTRLQSRNSNNNKIFDTNATDSSESNDNNGDGTAIDDDCLTENLYQGVVANIWKEGPSSALSLSAYEFVKLGLLRALAANPKFVAINPFQVYLLAGAAGELVGSVIQAPAEVVKSLVQSKKVETTSQAIHQVWGRPEGVIRAWSAAIWRDVPFSAIQLCVFELVKAYILANPNTFGNLDSTTLTAEAAIGAFAGGCGALLTTPTDVITARIISQKLELTTATPSTGDDNHDAANNDVYSGENGGTTASEDESKPLGPIGMAKQIYDEDGIDGFFVGWQARVGYWSPAISIFLTTYCSIRQAGIEYEWFGQ